MNNINELELKVDSPPNKIFEARDETLGVLGYVVIDRPLLGKASGGIRFAPDITVDEVSSLARSMTYKWGFLNIPMGGAKAGIFVNPEQLGIDRNTLMQAFGRAISPLVQQEEYLPGVDLGTTLDDLTVIMRAAGKPLAEQQIDGSFCTALTVFETIKQIVKISNEDYKNLTVAIEGYGKVGSSLSSLIDKLGMKLVATSTEEGAIVHPDGLDVNLLQSLKEKYGNLLVHHYPGVSRINTSELFIQPVDILVPGARPYVLNSENVNAIHAKWIVPISNIPVTLENEIILEKRNKLVIPDFLANCGGVLSSHMLSMGFSEKDVQRLVESQFSKIVFKILFDANLRGGVVREISQEVAWKNHLRLNDPDSSSETRTVRLIGVIKEEGVSGFWRRLAWRIHQNWPSVNGGIHNAAVDQYGVWGLGKTIKQVYSRDTVN